MKLHIAMLLSAAMLSGGASYAQDTAPDKPKAKAYMVADAHLDTCLLYTSRCV